MGGRGGADKVGVGYGGRSERGVADSARGPGGALKAGQGGCQGRGLCGLVLQAAGIERYQKQALKKHRTQPAPPLVRPQLLAATRQLLLLLLLPPPPPPPARPAVPEQQSVNQVCGVGPGPAAGQGVQQPAQRDEGQRERRQQQQAQPATGLRSTNGCCIVVLHGDVLIVGTGLVRARDAGGVAMHGWARFSRAGGRGLGGERGVAAVRRLRVLCRKVGGSKGARADLKSRMVRCSSLELSDTKCRRTATRREPLEALEKSGISFPVRSAGTTCRAAAMSSQAATY